MATTTRFMLPNSNPPGMTLPAIPFHANWDFVDQAERVYMPRKLTEEWTTDLADKIVVSTTLANNTYLFRQYISEPLPVQHLLYGPTPSGFIRTMEADLGNNARIYMTLRIVNDVGATRITPVSGNLTTEFPVTTPSTVTLGAGSSWTIGGVWTKPGDRLVFEIGVYTPNPTTNGNMTMRFGNPSGVAEFTAASQTTDLRPWLQVSIEMFTHNHLRAGNTGTRPAPFAPGRAR